MKFRITENIEKLCWCVGSVGVDDDREMQSFESLGMVFFFVCLYIAEKKAPIYT